MNLFASRRTTRVARKWRIDDGGAGEQLTVDRP
ncbi:hypothetical protein EVAR_71056_1, partial [Eumeta japonica]